MLDLSNCPYLIRYRKYSCACLLEVNLWKMIKLPGLTVHINISVIQNIFLKNLFQ